MDRGGCNLAPDQDRLIVVGRSTFEKFLPATTLKRMNETHKQYCACHECLHTEWMHEAMMKNCERRLAVLHQLTNIAVTQNTNQAAIEYQTKKYDDYHEFLY